MVFLSSEYHNHPSAHWKIEIHMSSNVFVMCLCLKIYFLKGRYCKGSEITFLFPWKCQILLPFRQGDKVCNIDYGIKGLFNKRNPATKKVHIYKLSCLVTQRPSSVWKLLLSNPVWSYQEDDKSRRSGTCTLRQPSLCSFCRWLQWVPRVRKYDCFQNV